MKKIKVGYLPLYIKLYDDSNPHYRDPMVDYMHMLIKMLESQGLEVVLADEVCRIKPEFDGRRKSSTTPASPPSSRSIWPTPLPWSPLRRC